MNPAINRLSLSDENKYSGSPNWASPTRLQATSSLENEGNWTNTLDNGVEQGLNEDIDEERNSGISLVSEDFTMEFFKPLQDSNEEDRKEALDSIIKLLLNSLATESKELIRSHLLRIVRYSYQVPFKDVVLAFQSLIQKIKEEGILTLEYNIPNPSYFIPSKYFPPVYEAEGEYLSIYIDIFLQSGRVSNLNRVLALHPTYFVKYYAAYNFIMRDDGPLPLSWRNYIAILTASRSKCHWLVLKEEEEFLLNGGNPKWLIGYVNAPKKLVNLMDVIVILCHQPWLLTKNHIANLVKGSDSWSMGELVHAMLVICTSNSLAGIVHGCGVAYEVDLAHLTVVSEDPEEEEIKEGIVMDDTNKLAEMLKSGFNAETEEQQVQLFVKAEVPDTPCANYQTPPSVHKTAQGSPIKTCANYVGEYNLQHVDFDVHSKTYGIFKVQDYCWKEDGFELARRFLPGAATLLEEEFNHIYTMTYNMFNQSTNVDTLPFRRAIWQYVQRVKGMFHDDYNYQEVNMLLNRSTKAYVKKIVCYPETITKSDYVNVGLALRPDEKVHAALLAVESAKQSTLLYGLHAVMQHITSV